MSSQMLVLGIIRSRGLTWSVALEFVRPYAQSDVRGLTLLFTP